MVQPEAGLYWNIDWASGRRDADAPRASSGRDGSKCMFARDAMGFTVQPSEEMARPRRDVKISSRPAAKEYLCRVVSEAYGVG